MQYDFVRLLDGRHLAGARERRGVAGPALRSDLHQMRTSRRGIFIELLLAGLWHMAVYNDGDRVQVLGLITSSTGG